MFRSCNGVNKNLERAQAKVNDMPSRDDFNDFAKCVKALGEETTAAIENWKDTMKKQWEESEEAWEKLEKELEEFTREQERKREEFSKAREEARKKRAKEYEEELEARRERQDMDEQYRKEERSAAMDKKHDDSSE